MYVCVCACVCACVGVGVYVCACMHVWYMLVSIQYIHDILNSSESNGASLEGGSKKEINIKPFTSVRNHICPIHNIKHITHTHTHT